MATATLAASPARLSIFARIANWFDRFASTDFMDEYGRDLQAYHARFRGF